MKYNILKNEKRKSITLVFNELQLFDNSVKYLYENYVDPKTNEKKNGYFGNGLIKCENKEFLSMLAEVAQEYNKLNPNGITLKNLNGLFKSNEETYGAFECKFDNEGKVKPDTFNLKLNSRIMAPIFRNVGSNKKIELYEINNFEYMVELEFMPYVNKEDETKVLTILHRIVAEKIKDGYGSRNDEAFKGFGSIDKETFEEEAQQEYTSDNLPF